MAIDVKEVRIWYKPRGSKHAYASKFHKKLIRKTDIDAIKKYARDVVAKLEGKAEYYYIVIRVERGDKTPGYRTIVGKTFLK